MPHALWLRRTLTGLLMHLVARHLAHQPVLSMVAPPIPKTFDPETRARRNRNLCNRVLWLILLLLALNIRSLIVMYYPRVLRRNPTITATATYVLPRTRAHQDILIPTRQCGEIFRMSGPSTK
ncbi:hypothetical protein F5878DRAFT_607366 [Lentinula raphanica]|uniref:Uncharacterized protein n=1 Tax=Lentinula raphanica TaxID=153919 RepID=A0AA38PH29_9AGAR|nr:hypothetical protein F5878DRAFT_607366 [Lentinula raphanica]